MHKQTVIKICGLRDPDLASKAVVFGADMIGLIHYPLSRRHVNVDLARRIADKVKQVNGEPVLVFVDASADEMQMLCTQTGVNTVQLHGDVSRRAHHQLPPEIKRIFAIPVANDGNIIEVHTVGVEHLDPQRDLLLFDGEQAGSGKRFSFEDFTNPYSLSFLLAGGLSAENVKLAIKVVNPLGVDVSSGVETSKGVKDEGMIKRFIAMVRNDD